MKIAVIGAGFCGLATTWYLLQHQHQVTLFDSKEIGQSTSAIAAGLLHEFAGAHSKLNWGAEEGMRASLSLISEVEEKLKISIATRTGIFRPAYTEEQIEDYKKCVNRYPQTFWYIPKETESKGLTLQPGVMIHNAYVVDCYNYIQGLWELCRNRGATFQKHKFSDLSELDAFDCIIVTAGANTTFFPELKQLPLNRVKGQVLEFRWPEQLPPLSYPINSHAYMLMHMNKKSCIVGSSYERDFTHENPDLQKAVEEILPKLHAFCPILTATDVIDCRAGMRSTTPNHRPFLKQVSSKIWVLAGMGSKGLLYHAMFAKELANRINK